MHMLNEENLNRLKERLNNYKFCKTNKNGSMIDPDYAKYVLDLRFQWDQLAPCIIDMQDYQESENKLLYSKNDVPLILGYMDCIQQLIKVSNHIVKDVYSIKLLKLSGSMNKKSTINIALEMQNNLINVYDALFDEMLKILEIKKE